MESVQTGLLVAFFVLAGALYFLLRLRGRQRLELSDAVRRLLAAELRRASEPCRELLETAPDGSAIRAPPMKFCADLPLILQPGYGPLRHLSEEERALAAEFGDRLAELQHRATRLTGVDLRPDLEALIESADRLEAKLAESGHGASTR